MMNFVTVEQCAVMADVSVRTVSRDITKGSLVSRPLPTLAPSFTAFGVFLGVMFAWFDFLLVAAGLAVLFGVVALQQVF